MYIIKTNIFIVSDDDTRIIQYELQKFLLVSTKLFSTISYFHTFLIVIRFFVKLTRILVDVTSYSANFFHVYMHELYLDLPGFTFFERTHIPCIKSLFNPLISPVNVVFIFFPSFFSFISIDVMLR